MTAASDMPCIRQIAGAVKKRQTKVVMLVTIGAPSAAMRRSMPGQAWGSSALTGFSGLAAHPQSGP
jgi:hypothetical protein